MIRAAILALSVATLSAALAAGPAAAADSTQAAATQLSAKDYVQKAGSADMFEVESSRIALQKSKAEPVKNYATKMVDDHSRSTRKLKQALGNGKATLTPPTALDGPHQELLEKLNAANGGEFDKLYLQMQLKGHQEAVELHRSYAKAGDNAALKAFASEVAPVVESHLAEVQQLMREQGG